jgi:hypothetical protein
MSHVPTVWHSSDAVQTRAVPVQTPAAQLSPVVQGLLSLQVVPLAASGLLQTPVVGSQVPTTWQASSAVQVTGVPAVQVPFMHDEPQVPPQGEPLALFTCPQVPLLGVQAPTWQSSAAAQVTGFAPVQAPAWQVSVCVQALLSLHVVPSASCGMLHEPVLRSHAPAPWQLSAAVQVMGLPPVQTPATQVSVCVQGSASLQVVPSAAAGLLQAPVDGLQAPATWQAFDAVQTIGFDPVQMPATQVSVCEQALASLHSDPSARAGLSQAPVDGLQVPAAWH